MKNLQVLLYSKLHRKIMRLLINNIYEKISRWLSRISARVSRDQGKIAPSIAPSRACAWFENKRLIGHLQANLMHVFREGASAITQTHNNNNNNNIELYLHEYNNKVLQKRQKHDNYSNLVIRVQFQHWYKSNNNIYPKFQIRSNQFVSNFKARWDEHN